MQLGFWRLPNDINYAGILIRITPDGAMEEVSLKDIRHSVSTLPKMIESGPHPWREADKRSEAITDIAFADGRLYVAGLSNEEFASCLRVLDFPFSDEPGAFCTIEVFHVAHGKSETEAPIRTLLPYDINGVPHILASYTCTPFVSIPVSELQTGRHVKSKTLGEFGFGNMPIDMVGFEKNGKSLLLMSSNSKALIRIDPEDIPRQKEGLVQPLEKGAYTAGLPHYVWSVVGVTQLDNLNKDNLMALQRMPNGALDLRALSVKWF